MRIMTCVKYVPDPTEPAAFTVDSRIDRSVGGQLSELDEYAVGRTLQLASELAAGSVAVSMGPEEADGALRRALQLGVGEAVLIADPALAGSDVFATARVLAAAARSLDVELIVCGMSSTDAGTGVVPALLAAELGWPLLSHASAVEAAGDGLRITRLDEAGSRQASAGLPAVVSVTDQSGEPPYPSFKDVLAAKRKQVAIRSLTDLGIDPDGVGSAAARVVIDEVVRSPERPAGRILTDTDGDSVAELAAFLTAPAN